MALGSTLATSESFTKRARREFRPRGVVNRMVREELRDVSYVRFKRMTPRLEECRELMSRGLGDKDIALRMGITVGAVKTYSYAVRKFTGKNRVAIQCEGFRAVSEAEGLPRMGAFE